MPGRVRQIERDRAIAIDPDVPETCCGPRSVVTQLAVANAPTAIFQRRAVAIIRDGTVEQFLQGRGRDRAIPTHPGWVGFFPGKGAARGHRSLVLYRCIPEIVAWIALRSIQATTPPA